MGLCAASYTVPSLPMVQYWDGMDTRDSTWDSVGYLMLSHGTVGHNGQLRIERTLWDIPFHPVPSHGTMGYNGQFVGNPGLV